MHLSSADAPWQNVISEAPNKSVRGAIALAIGESEMTLPELQTVCFEAAKLINERPVQLLDTQPHWMMNHTNAPMISYMDVQRHEYQVDHLYKRVINDTDTNSFKKREDNTERHG